jgi:hypothetical protein
VKDEPSKISAELLDQLAARQMSLVNVGGAEFGFGCVETAQKLTPFFKICLMPVEFIPTYRKLRAVQARRGGRGFLGHVSELRDELG